MWELYGFEIVLGLCIVFLLGLGLYYKSTGRTGTFSRDKYFIGPVKSRKRVTHRSPPPRESKGEIECRRVLQDLFNKPFHKTRPNFLKNPVTGGHFNLELDCFNSELALAVEYNGAQHYKFTPYFHRNNEHFLNQKYRDDMKRRLCRESNITLIEVPYTVKLDNIRNFIIKACIHAGYKFHSR